MCSRVDPTVSRRGTCDRGIWRKPLSFCGGRGGLYEYYVMGIEWAFRHFIASAMSKIAEIETELLGTSA
jgi:hypothetical protein